MPLMPAPLAQVKKWAGEKTSHALFVCDAKSELRPEKESFNSTLARSQKRLSEAPLFSTLPSGAFAVWVGVEKKDPPFFRLEAICQGLSLILDENPQTLRLWVDPELGEEIACEALYTVLANGAPLYQRKKEPQTPLCQIWADGALADMDFFPAQVFSQANLRARYWTSSPPDALTVESFAGLALDLAHEVGAEAEVFDRARLHELGAGGFDAVGRGGAENETRLVRLCRGQGKRKLALVGKGVCFDAGGLNLKPARAMAGMHRDMAGAAAVLAAFLGAQTLGIESKVEAWLALATNWVGPDAYHPGEVLTMADGTTVEVVHTDAEGRLLLADTLALARRGGASAMVDLATLTGACVVALGERHSGVFANDKDLLQDLIQAGEKAGERLHPFPLTKDYDSALKSKTADVKQCLLEGEADHILAARFLCRFAGDTPWAHLDLSSAWCKEGLGGALSEETGFGAALLLEFIRLWEKRLA